MSTKKGGTERENRIDYIELSVFSIERSKAVYGEVFGWTFTDSGRTIANSRTAA